MHSVFIRQNPFSTEFEIYVTNGHVFNPAGKAYSHEVENRYSKHTWQIMLEWFGLEESGADVVPLTERVMAKADWWVDKFKRAGIKTYMVNQMVRDHFDPEPEPRPKSRRKS